MTAPPTVVTRAKETMAIATLEDLQGIFEVVVFPKLYGAIGDRFAEGATLIVAGRVNHRGDEVSLAADTVLSLEDAVAKGAKVVADELARAEHGRAKGHWGRKNGAASGPANGAANGPAATEPEAAAGPRMRVSPLRGGGVEPVVAAPSVAPALPMPGPADLMPPEPLSGEPGPDDLAALDWEEDEPALPDEARAAVVRASSAPTAPLEASERGVLHVRFGRAAGPDQIVRAMEELKTVLRERPGDTRVIVELPAADGTVAPMEIRYGVAYDAELLAEARRRLGEGLVTLDLALGRE